MGLAQISYLWSHDLLRFLISSYRHATLGVQTRHIEFQDLNLWAKDSYRKNLSKCCHQKRRRPEKRVGRFLPRQTNKQKSTKLFSGSHIKFQVFMSFPPQILINCSSCVPWKFVNIISFGKAFPAFFPCTTIYLVSWFSFLSVGSMVQLKDNGPKCLA